MSRSSTAIPLPLARRIVKTVFGEHSPGLAAWVAGLGATMQDELAPDELESVLTDATRAAYGSMKAAFGRNQFTPSDCGPLLLVTMRDALMKLREARDEEGAPAEPPEDEGDAPTGDPPPPDAEGLALFAAGRAAGLERMWTAEELAGAQPDWIAGYEEGQREAQRNQRAAAEQARGRGRAERRKQE